MASVVVLRSGDGEVFEVEKAVALESHKVKRLIEDMGTGSPIPLPEDVPSKVVHKVFDYCKYHLEAHKGGASAEAINTWDADFIRLSDRETVFDLVVASMYLNIRLLFDLSCEAVAEMHRRATLV